MATGRQIQKKAQSNATPTPATGMFKPRPFAIPAEPETTPELQTKAEPEPVGGNRLSRMDVSAPPPIQPKLAIGAPDDKYEQETDTIARKVVKQISAPTPPDANSSGDSVQRQMFSTPSIMRLTVQRKEAIEGGTASSDLESTIRQARSSGRPLGKPIRRQMEGAFGTDFSGVRVHTHNTADTLNRSLSARAFTTGNNIFFKQGEYNPASSRGQELLAHELTHVVQQRGNSSIQRQLTSDQIEHANRMRAARGLEEIFDVKTTLKKFKSWDKVKEKFANDPGTMKQFFDFRKSYVDSLINQLREKYHHLIAKSVGSQDLTSDYDITICSPNSGNDVKAIKDFNAKVHQDFGVEPGTLFDTNLYAKDYLQVEENINKEAVKGKAPDADLEQPDGQFGTMGHLSQDVAALVKQRRYMKQVEWDRYVDDVLKSIDDKELQKLTRLQYEEADAVYQIFAHELLQEVEKSPAYKRNKGLHNIKVKLGQEEREALKQIKIPNRLVRKLEILMGREF